jgi:hypothetical protein
MSMPAPQLEYSLPKPGKSAKNAAIVLYAFGGAMVCSAVWSVFNLNIFLDEAMNVRRYAWDSIVPSRISGFRFEGTLTEFGRIAIGLIVFHLAAAFAFVITAARIRKGSIVWPSVSVIVSLLIAVIHGMDIYAGQGAALWNRWNGSWDWTNLRLMIYLAFHGAVIVLAVAAAVMMIMAIAFVAKNPNVVKHLRGNDGGFRG